MAAKKVKLQVIHPSFDGHKFGDIISVEEKSVTERMKLFTKPYETPKGVEDAFKKDEAELAKKLKELEAKEAELAEREKVIEAKEAELAKTPEETEK